MRDPREPPKRQSCNSAGGGDGGPGDLSLQGEPPAILCWRAGSGIPGTHERTQLCYKSGIGDSGDSPRGEPRNYLLEGWARDRGVPKPSELRQLPAPPARSETRPSARGVGARLGARAERAAAAASLPHPDPAWLFIQKSVGLSPGPWAPALTCAAITRCLSAIRLHFLHWQSRHMQKRLWPLSGDA